MSDARNDPQVIADTRHLAKRNSDSF